jgi:integrase
MFTVEKCVGGTKPTSRPADAVLLLSATGMRVGEVLAIKWEDIDFSSTPSSVAVKCTLVEEKFLYRQDVPKTEGNDRVYPIIVPWASGMNVAGLAAPV